MLTFVYFRLTFLFSLIILISNMFQNNIKIVFRKEWYHSMNQTTSASVNSNRPLTTSRLVRIALVTAVTCILAPMSIPIPLSPVPITLTNLVLLTGLYVLDWKDSLISYVIYLLIRTCRTPRIFRIFRRPWQNCRTNRRISCRLSDHAPNRRSDCSRLPRKADPFHLRNDPRLCRHLPFWHLMACLPDGSWLYGRFIYRCTPLSGRRSDQNTHCCRYRSGYWRKDQIHRTNKIASILYKVAKKRNQAARMIKLPDFYLSILLFSCAQ